AAPMPEAAPVTRAEDPVMSMAPDPSEGVVCLRVRPNARSGTRPLQRRGAAGADDRRSTQEHLVVGGPGDRERPARDIDAVGQVVAGRTTVGQRGPDHG